MWKTKTTDFKMVGFTKDYYLHTFRQQLFLTGKSQCNVKETFKMLTIYIGLDLPYKIKQLRTDRYNFKDTFLT